MNLPDRNLHTRPIPDSPKTDLNGRFRPIDPPKEALRITGCAHQPDTEYRRDLAGFIGLKAKRDLVLAANQRFRNGKADVVEARWFTARLSVIGQQLIVDQDREFARRVAAVVAVEADYQRQRRGGIDRDIVSKP